MLSTGSRRFRILIRWESTEDFVIVIKLILEGGINAPCMTATGIQPPKKETAACPKGRKRKKRKVKRNSICFM